MGKFLKAQTFIVAIVLVLCITLTPAAHALPVVDPNVDITVSSDSAERQQVEPSIAVDPHNPCIIVAGATPRTIGYSLREGTGGTATTVRLTQVRAGVKCFSQGIRAIILPRD